MANIVVQPGSFHSTDSAWLRLQRQHDHRAPYEERLAPGLVYIGMGPAHIRAPPQHTHAPRRSRANASRQTSILPRGISATNGGKRHSNCPPTSNRTPRNGIGQGLAQGHPGPAPSACPRQEPCPRHEPCTRHEPILLLWLRSVQCDKKGNLLFELRVGCERFRGQRQPRQRRGVVVYEPRLNCCSIIAMAVDRPHGIIHDVL